jgi:hypothetical protein
VAEEESAMKVAIELNYGGFDESPGQERPGKYRKLFDVGWPRIPSVGEKVQITGAGEFEVKGVRFEVEGPVTLTFDVPPKGLTGTLDSLRADGWEGPS